MTIEEAIERIKARFDKWSLDNEDMKAIQILISKFAEKEDERIRKAIGTALCSTMSESILDANGVKLTEALAYLENQKNETDRRLEMVEQHCKNVDELGEKIKSLQKKLYEKQKEQKSVTSENDFVSKPNNSVEILRHYLVWAGSSEEDCPYTWKTLADAIRDGIRALEEEKPAEWSKEEEKHLYNAIEAVKYVYDVSAGSSGAQCIEFLKSIPERLNLQPKQEWSEEDKKMYQILIHNLEVICEKVYPYNVHLKKELNWLKALRPQPHWKPSEKQMDALSDAYVDASTFKKRDILESLYNDLKKL